MTNPERYQIICDGASIGKGTRIGHNVFIGEHVYIGPDCNIQGNVFIPSGVSIGSRTFIGPGVTFCNVKHPPLPQDRKGQYDKTIIGYGSSIGAGATILPGIDVHPLTVIGAGAVMTKSTKKPGITYVGNPARPIKRSFWKRLVSFCMSTSDHRGPR